jgi:hypothetical protein
MAIRRGGGGQETPSFWVVVEDHEAKVFDIYGPLTRDVEWTNRVELARGRGRDVTICTVTNEVDASMTAHALIEAGFQKANVALASL